MLSKLISDNYDIEITNLKLIDRHFGTGIFLAETDEKKYIIKTLPAYVKNLENEGFITDYLYKSGVNVARLVKTKNGVYHVESDEMQFHIQEFIEGETLRVNTAPEWFLKESAHTLGKIHNVLRDYHELELEINFGKDFFDASNALNAKKHYSERLYEATEAADKKDEPLIAAIHERIKHLERISSFDIDTDKLTYSNSHGDFHIGQIIANNKKLTVIDWTSACRLPVSLEVMMSYTTSDIECRDGKISGSRLKKYISDYEKHFTLNSYDIKMMPFVFYFQQILCHYPPPYDNVAETYKPICDLINNFTGWLYENAENLSDELSSL